MESFGSCTEYNLLGINTSTFGRKTHFGFSPRSFVFRPEQWFTPMKLHETSLLCEARSTSAFRGQLIPVQLPPQLVCSLLHSSRDWGGRGEAFSFSTSSQVQLEAADGPGSRPYCLRHSDRTTVETGFPHCWSASFGKWTCHSLRLFQEAAETCHVSTESFSLTQRATGFFF